MSAEPIPNDPPNRHKDSIQRFREAYSGALIDARVSAEHTATEGWAKLYHGFMAEDEKRRRAIAEELTQLAQVIESAGLDQEQEKQIGEIKKAMTDSRLARHAFDAQAVEPVKRPVLTCNQIIDDAKHASRREEMDAPLVNVGLEHLMREAVAVVPKVSWDDEAGRVLVSPD